MNNVEKHIITKDNPVYALLAGRCLLSNNVYNEAMYASRQHYFLKTGQNYTDEILPEVFNKTLNYNELQKYLSTHSDNYKQLSANAAQLTIKKVCEAFKSFYNLLKKKKAGQYDQPVNLPKYKKSGDLYDVTYNKQALSDVTYMQTGYISLPKTDIILPIKVKHYAEMTQLSLVPKYGAIEVIISYRVSDISLESPNDNFMSIDPGISNLLTCVSNVMQSFIIDGRPVKEVNQWYNKIKSEQYSKLDNEINKDVWAEINKIKYDNTLDSSQKKNLTYPLYKNIVRTTKRLERESLYRNNFITDYFHKASSYIVNQAVKHNIRTIIIGSNKNWKQETNMGSTNNQNFVSIPHTKLFKMIEYKANKVGITVVYTEESYTSKASFLNNDYIPSYGDEDAAEYEFSGYRKSRGLYKIKGTNIVINADVNGAFNILRKYLNANTEAVMPSVRGFVFNPHKVSLLTLCNKEKETVEKINSF